MKYIKHAKKCKKNEPDNLTGGGHVIPKRCDCDGYHTFDELYEHRITLYMALCELQNTLNDECGLEQTKVWKSKKHSDGEICFGTGTQFVMGIGELSGYQITYHIPIEKWNDCWFAEDLDIAPEFDGHTSDDVLDRLKEL